MSEISPGLIDRLRTRLKSELEELDALLQQTARDSAPVQLDQQSVHGCDADTGHGPGNAAAESGVRVSRRLSGVSNKESSAIARVVAKPSPRSGWRSTRLIVCA
jgi:hypothetical protein